MPSENTDSTRETAGLRAVLFGADTVPDSAGPPIGPDGTARRATMTVREVLTWLSPEPDPYYAGSPPPPRDSPFHGSAEVWPLVLGLEHMDAVDKGNAAGAAHLARDIEALGAQFGNIPADTKSLLKRSRLPIGALIEEGRDLCDRERRAREAWQRARDAWQRARLLLRDALRGGRVRARGCRCDEWGNAIREGYEEILPLTWSSPLVPADDGRIVHDGTERLFGQPPSEAGLRFAKLQFMTEDIIKLGATVRAANNLAAAPLGIAPTSKPARRSNGRNYTDDDAPLVAEMRAMIETGTAQSPDDAARTVVGRAVGGGKPESKVARLAMRYRGTYPAQS